MSSATDREDAELDEASFEGTEVLEQLAAIGKVDEFFDAIDADDERRAVALMRQANIDAGTIEIVVEKMRAADGSH